MNLTLDIGNSHIKAALFDPSGAMIAHYEQLEQATPADWPRESIQKAIVCASGRTPDLSRWLPDSVTPHWLDADTPLPIRLDYATPQTLGADRIAAACGAWTLHPHGNSLIVDAGTCVTVDFVDADGVYHGGAILPGMAMQFQALHTFTAKLPLIEYDGPSSADIPPCGRSTREAITAGVVCGLHYTLAGFVDHYCSRYDDLRVFYTGGMPTLPEPQEPHLVLLGLNAILKELKIERTSSTSRTKK